MSTAPERPAGVRLTTVLLVAVSATVVSAALWVWLGRSGSLVPAPQLLAGAALLALSVTVGWFAWPVRRYQRSAGTHAVDPIRAARAVVLAQAGALTGGAATGWYLGQALALAADLSLVIAQRRLLGVLLMVGLSALLAATGLLAQRWCRVPPSSDH